MNQGKIFAGVLIGIAAGIVAGILYAPDKGTEIRRKIADKGKDVAESIKETYNEYGDTLLEKYNAVTDKVRDDADTAKNSVGETVNREAGQQRMQEQNPPTNYQADHYNQ